MRSSASQEPKIIHIEVEYKEGKKMDVADYGSRAPISEDNHREFRISNNDIGIKVKTNRVKRLNIRDHCLTKLAEIII